MAKRFLCYDTDNPVGVTPEGVLDANAMGGADLIFRCDTGYLYSNVLPREHIEVICDDISAYIDKVSSGKPVNVLFETTYMYDGVMIEYEAVQAIQVVHNNRQAYNKVAFLYGNTGQANIANGDIIIVTIIFNNDGTITEILRTGYNLVDSSITLKEHL